MRDHPANDYGSHPSKNKFNKIYFNPNMGIQQIYFLLKRAFRVADCRRYARRIFQETKN